MSYLRINSPYVYVEGFSEDYVYETGRKESCIQDYGSISNKSIVELLLRFGNENDDLILLQMGKRLAENLNIKLRKKPLTDEQWLKLFNEKQKELTKKFAENTGDEE